MPSQPKTWCFYGDSHLASVKLARDQGLLGEIGDRVSFWGAPGPSFRGLRMLDGRIVPDPDAREDLALVRGDGPETLGPQDYDHFVFYGARMRLGEYLKAVSDHQATMGYLSDAVLAEATSGWLEGVRAYRFARSFAAAGAKVFFVPTPLPTKGIVNARAEKRLYRIARRRKQVDRILKGLDARCTADGVHLVLQPGETLTPDLMTRPDFAIDAAQAAKDVVHKSPEFAAIMVGEVVSRLAA